MKCFINRAFIVCSNWFTFHEEISKLKDIFHINGYPKEIFCNRIKKFLGEKLMTANSCQNMNDEKKYTVIMPFTGHPSIALKKSLTKNLKSFNKKCTKLKTFQVQKYFSLKDETPLALQENVVYLFAGSCDKNQTYIGKTKRHLAIRVREHLSGNSAIREHISSCNACNHSAIENFNILSHGSNDFDNKVKEALYIRKQRPLLNKHLHQHGESFAHCILIIIKLISNCNMAYDHIYRLYIVTFSLAYLCSKNFFLSICIALYHNSLCRY